MIRRRSDSLSEPMLVSLLIKNDRNAFEYLYDNYSPALYGLIVKIVKDKQVANDVLQEAFIKIWKNITYYNKEKGTLFTWMLNVCRHTAIDHLRVCRKFENNVEWDAVKDQELTGAALVHFSPMAIDLKSCMAQLRPERKQLLELVYIDGYTHEEASRKLRMPLGTVKTRIRASLTELRTIFDFSASKD